MWAERLAEILQVQISETFVHCFRKRGDISIPLYRFRKAVEEVRSEFGCDKSESPRERAAIKKMIAQIHIMKEQAEMSEQSQSRSRDRRTARKRGKKK